MLVRLQDLKVEKVSLRFIHGEPHLYYQGEPLVLSIERLQTSTGASSEGCFFQERLFLVYFPHHREKLQQLAQHLHCNSKTQPLNFSETWNIILDQEFFEGPEGYPVPFSEIRAGWLKTVIVQPKFMLLRNEWVLRFTALFILPWSTSARRREQVTIALCQVFHQTLLKHPLVEPKLIALIITQLLGY